MAKSASNKNLNTSYCYHDEVIKAQNALFEIFQLADPALRQSLFASILIENSVTLLSGTYGTGKTQLVRLIRKIFFSDDEGDYLFDYESCHQELTAFDVLYHLDLAELQRGNEVVHPKKMVSARLKFLNEIQRANTGFFNVLLPMFSERRITYRDFEFEVPDFICIMDRNPLDAGSSEIPEAFMDRIDFSFDIPAIHLVEHLNLLEIRQDDQKGYHWGELENSIQPILTFNQLQDVWNDVKKVAIPPRITLLVGMVTDALRLCISCERSTALPDFDLNCHECQFQGEICSHLQKVPGQRVTNSALRLAQALAWLEKKPAVEDRHLFAALPWCMSHRLAIRPEERRKMPSAQEWVRSIAISEILRPKTPHWNKALDAFEKKDRESLEALGENDLVVRALQLMQEDLQQ